MPIISYQRDSLTLVIHNIGYGSTNGPIKTNLFPIATYLTLTILLDAVINFLILVTSFISWPLYNLWRIRETTLYPGYAMEV